MQSSLSALGFAIHLYLGTAVSLHSINLNSIKNSIPGSFKFIIERSYTDIFSRSGPNPYNFRSISSNYNNSRILRMSLCSRFSNFQIPMRLRVRRFYLSVASFD